MLRNRGDGLCHQIFFCVPQDVVSDRIGEIVILRAAPHSCNAWANSHSWGSFLPRLQRDVLVEAATHCDFENPGDPVCSAACGAADPQRQAAIRAEVAAAVDQWLR